MFYTINQKDFTQRPTHTNMQGRSKKTKGNGSGADANHSDGSGHNEPLPPLYWSVLHHQNLHGDSQRHDCMASTSSEVPINSEASPLVKEMSSGGGSSSSSSSNKRWGRVKEAVKSNELFIRYTSGLDASSSDEHKTQRWSDLTNVSYELTLRECLFLFIALLASGVLAYSFIFEHWGIIDSLYFTVVMLSTTGYGDVSPTSPGGKLFASVFAIAGIVLLGLVLGVVGSQLVEAEITYSQKMKTEASKVLEKTFIAKPHHKPDEHVVDKSLPLRNDSSMSVESVEPIEAAASPHRIFISRVMKQLPGLVPLMIGGIVMAILEHWVWYDVIYYCIATATVRVSVIGGRVFIDIIVSPTSFCFLSRHNLSTRQSGLEI
jgi:voltage-gated potassium channel